MFKKEVIIVSESGLHTRASAELNQLANKFESAVWISREGRKVNAKSITDLMTLGAGVGATLSVEANGDDERECVDAISRLIQDERGEVG
ncbi:HPr family phosphocarrier protein [Pseudomonas fluorescens]|uniref:Phosphocarrier protein HPr n=1 Tax=Pseudomonas fluorescens TaxID=294 RepID=A0A5E7DY14_PSEFL|nr:HPr family phosphocarrier protein [Pseudomonas fluorescens]VVO17465.1 Phosphocarrier protein HPr [Pseudomonas fluorescens]